MKRLIQKLQLLWYKLFNPSKFMEEEIKNKIINLYNILSGYTISNFQFVFQPESRVLQSLTFKITNHLTSIGLIQVTVENKNHLEFENRILGEGIVTNDVKRILVSIWDNESIVRSHLNGYFGIQN